MTIETETAPPAELETSPSPALAAAGEDNDELDLLDLLIVLAEHKKTILRTTLAAVVLAAVVSLLLPNRYTATTQILPPQQSHSLASALMGQLGSLGPMAALAGSGLGLKNPNDLYVGMLKSRTVEDALIQRFDLRKLYHDKKMHDARKDLESYSDITPGKEGLISISVEDKNPQRAAAVANAYVEELHKVMQGIAITEAAQRRLFFQREMEQAKDNLANAEVALEQTQQKTGLIQLDDQARAMLQGFSRLQGEVIAAETELEGLRQIYSENNTRVRAAEARLGELKRQLANMETESEPASGASPDGNLLVSTGRVPAAGLEYVRKLRDVKYYETIFELVAKQYEAAKLDEAKSAPVIQVVDPAVPPDTRSSPKRTLIVVIVAVLAIFGSMLYVLAREAFQRMRAEPETNARLTALRAGLRLKP